MWKVCVATAVVLGFGCASDEDSEQNGNRSPGAGKADVSGSCAAADCGDKASTGNCWCDEACLGNGDCCSNKPTVCEGGLQFATYNAGFAHGAVPFAEERRQPVIDELAQSPADVLCLQEVWSDADAEAIIAGVASTFPHAFREVTENDDNDWFACGPTQWLKLYSMNSCVSDKCTPDGISAFECAADQCASEWGALNETCKLCLAANTTSPFSCAAWRAPKFGQEGRNGLLLLSRTKPDAVSYTPFDTHVIKRGVIRADIAGYQVQCTHMTADLGVVPYPSTGTYGSWKGEHAAQIKVMAEQAGTRRRTVMLGDLNTSPATPGVDPELAENFAALTAAGYVDTWTSGQQCTYCQDNPLVCSRPGGCGLSPRLDHVLLKNFETSIQAEFERTNERAITIKDSEGRSHETRLSDHYGVSATMPY